jgi:hypothetical protein
MDAGSFAGLPVYSVGRFGGSRIVHSEAMADRVEDYSACRSPSRATRRWKRRGIIGRVQFKLVPWKHAVTLPDGTIAMHPVTARAVREHVDAFSEKWKTIDGPAW